MGRIDSANFHVDSACRIDRCISAREYLAHTRKRWTSVDPLDGDPYESTLKRPFERALIRNLRMLNRPQWELRGDLALVSEQIATERADAARAKGQG